MASLLVTCSSCARHVKTSERACPFCGAAFSTEMRGHAVARGLSRAALVFAGAAAVAGCGKETKSPDPSPPSPTPVDTEVRTAPAYGAPPPFTMDAETPVPAPTTAPNAAPDAGAKKK